MPAKTRHPKNPSTQAEWEKLPDDEDWYVVLHSAVGTVNTARSYSYDDHGMKKLRHEAGAGEPVYQGSCQPAKAFGIGADMQRLVDLGAVREATPWEVEKVLSDFEAKGRTTPDQIIRPVDGPGVRVDEAGNPIDRGAPPTNQEVEEARKAEEARAKAAGEKADRERAQVVAEHKARADADARAKAEAEAKKQGG